jgi:predicted acetyltransferase
VGTEIRTIAEEELEAWVRATDVAFGERSEPEQLERERSVTELDRAFAAVEDGEIVGTAAAYSLRMRLPGGADVPTAGVTMVGVKPSHRRRGINTAMMRRLLDQARERGEPLAALFASEGGIYGRYGYGMATLQCSIDLETFASAFVPAYAPSGRVRMRELEEAIPTLVRVYERARRDRPGAVELDETRMRYQLHDHDEEARLPFFVAVHETEGEPDAYAVYKIKHDWPKGLPSNELVVYDLQGATPQAYADMWRFVLDVDLVRRVTAWHRPADEPLLHLLLEPRRLRATLRDGLWVRLVDVPAALEARGYAAEGRLVLEVRDAFCPSNEGRYALEVGGDAARCEPSDAPPDLVLDVEGLGAAYLGGVRFHDLWWAGRIPAAAPGALGLADAMFGVTAAPWCPMAF